MLTTIVIIAFFCFLIGMAVSVWAFGTGGKRANIFKDIYFSIEDADGIGILYTKSGEYSAILKMENPVQKFSADTDCYYDFTSLMTAIVQTLGEGYALHKQDIFVRRKFDMTQIDNSGKDENRRFLSDAYFRFFNGRPYTAASTYLVVTQESKKSALLSYDSSKWRDFLVKIRKVSDQLHDGGIKSARFLGVKEAREYADRFFAVNFRDKNISMTNFKVSSETIEMGNRQAKIYSLLDVDSVGLPGVLRPYVDMTVNNSVMPVDLMSEIGRAHV